MILRDFLILAAVCFGYGLNFVVGAWAVGQQGVPPFMLGGLRAIVVLVVMAPFLFKPRPEKFGLLLLVCICVGPLHLGFLYTGLITASASASGIVSQTLIPFATILSMIFLKETVGWRRGLGIVGAFIGVIIMIYRPGEFTFDIGLVYVILAYLALAIGSVIMKRVGDVDWRVYVTWMAVMVLPVMVAASLLTEPAWSGVIKEDSIPLFTAAIYAALGVTIFAHGQYFRLIKSYDVTQVVPLTLMTPIFATILGAWLLSEALTLQVWIGAALILPCVYIIARRQRTVPLIED